MERPIIFSDAMVRAILDGTKTQTRRLVRTLLPASEYEVVMHPGDGPALETFGDPLADEAERRFCPYGVPGDRLWVREAHQAHWVDDQRPDLDFTESQGVGWRVRYRATDGLVDLHYEDRGVGAWCRPSIHMPRWASRITLELTDVRVQRLQDISSAAARAEGVTPVGYGADAAAGEGHRLAFAFKWNEIHGGPTSITDGPPGPLGGAWAQNPWVWALTFKRVQVAV